MEKHYLRLMLVTQQQKIPLGPYLDFIENCARLGVTAIQLREKNSSYHDRKIVSEAIQHRIKPFDIPLIINDDLALSIAINADGVHLGQSDGSPWEARQQLGANKIIGVSIDTEENLIQANQLDIDYVGIGTIFPTQNKPNVTTTWGIHGLQKLKQRSTHPVVAIGGIDPSNAKEVLAAGADGIAVIGALHNTQNLSDTIRKLRGEYPC